MTDKEKLEKLKKLADAMYYAAFNLTTDASLLRKAMKEYHQFIIHEYHKEESVSEELEGAISTIKLLTSNTALLTFEHGFRKGAKWQKAKMMANAIDGEVLENYDGKVLEYDDLILDEKLSDCKVFDKVKIIVIKED